MGEGSFWLALIGPLTLLLGLAIAAFATMKIKTAEAWKEVALARKEEVDTLTNKLEGKDTENKELVTQLNDLKVEVEKLKALPNLTSLLEAFRLYQEADVKRYESAISLLETRFKNLGDDIDKRFTVFADRQHEYHMKELAQLSEIAAAISKS